jgi:hypothetical protein
MKRVSMIWLLVSGARRMPDGTRSVVSLDKQTRALPIETV